MDAKQSTNNNKRELHRQKLSNLITDAYRNLLSRPPEESELKTLLDNLETGAISRTMLNNRILQLSKSSPNEQLDAYNKVVHEYTFDPNGPKSIKPRKPSRLDYQAYKSESYTYPIQTTQIQNIKPKPDEDHQKASIIPDLKNPTEGTIKGITNLPADKVFLVKRICKDINNSTFTKISTKLTQLGITHEPHIIPNDDSKNVHMTIIERAKEEGLDSVCIIQDNVLLHEDFSKRLEKISEIPTDWTILYLGAFPQDKVGDKLYISKGYYIAKNTHGTFAYIVKNLIFDKLLNILKRNIPIDQALLLIQQAKKCYVVYENLIITNEQQYLTRYRDNYQTDMIMKARMLDWDISKYDISKDDPHKDI